jgi:hypothetical protein
MDSLGSGMRLLAEDEEPAPEKWELIFMSFVMIFFMFAALITDRVAPDHVFVIAVAFCMVTGIITISEGLKGFANEGVLTVMVRNKMSAFVCPTLEPIASIEDGDLVTRGRYRSCVTLPTRPYPRPTTSGLLLVVVANDLRISALSCVSSFLRINALSCVSSSLTPKRIPFLLCVAIRYCLWSRTD